MPDNYEQPDPGKPPIEVDLDDNGLVAEEIGEYDRTSKNLVPVFIKSEKGQEFLKTISQQVCEDHQQAWDGSEEWRERAAENSRIITGWLKKKILPYEGCANAHMPVALERLLRLVSNMFVEIFMERDTIFGVKPTGPDDYNTAEILTIHGNWQIQNEQTDFVRQQHRGLWEFNTTGSVFAHSGRDIVKGRNRHDVLTCNDIFLPYVWTTVETDLSDVPYKGRIIRKYRHEIERLRDTEDWANVDAVIEKAPPAWDSVDGARAREEGGKREGIIAPERDKKAPYVFFEYHGWCKMPGEKSLSPVCATVDKQTRTVVNLYVREEDDWQDLARREYQLEELARYQQDTSDYQGVMAKQQELQMLLQNPDILPEDAAELSGALDAEPLQPPIPPVWLEEKLALPPEMQQPDPVRRVPIEQFSHGVCVENPFGSLGLSFGNVLCDLNRLVNEAYNRFYDAAALANCWAIITPENLDFGSTNIPLGPGKQIRVKGVSGEQLRNQIVELKPAPANTQLLDIVGIAQAAADSSVAAPGVLSGEPGKSGETFRGLATRVERATRQLSAAGIKYLEFLGNILKNNARLNAYYMPEEQVIQLMDHLDLPEFLMQGRQRPSSRNMREIRVGRDMYRRNYSVSFTADVRFTSQQQRITEADELVGMTQLPHMAGNFAFAYQATAKALRARGQHDMIATLGPPPAPPELPMGTPAPMPDVMQGNSEEGLPPDATTADAGIPLPEAAPGGIQGPRPGVSV